MTNTKKKLKVKLEAIQQVEVTTKSSQIRLLFSEGKSRSEIAKIMNIRYQHVRNVLITPLKKVTN